MSSRRLSGPSRQAAPRERAVEGPTRCWWPRLQGHVAVCGGAGGRYPQASLSTTSQAARTSCSSAVVEHRTAETGSACRVIADCPTRSAVARDLALLQQRGRTAPLSRAEDMARHLPEQHRAWWRRPSTARAGSVRTVIGAGVRRRELRHCDPNSQRSPCDAVASMGKIATDDRAVPPCPISSSTCTPTTRPPRGAARLAQAMRRG